MQYMFTDVEVIFLSSRCPSELLGEKKVNLDIHHLSYKDFTAVYDEVVRRENGNDDVRSN